MIPAGAIIPKTRWCGSSTASKSGSRAIRAAYHGYLSYAMERRVWFAIGFVAFVLLSFLLVPFLGENFFPQVDAGAIALHVRAPVGTRIEETAALFDHVENRIRQVIPPDQLGAMVDNIGLPNSTTGTIYLNTGTLGPEDGDILISLNENHAPTADYVKRLRTVLPQSFPGSTFSFPPADMVSQVLNFGAPAPIDVQVAGPDSAKDQAYATELRNRIVSIPGAVDVRLQQSSSYPTFGVDVDRTRAGQVGISERDVTNSMVVNLAGSVQVAPTYLAQSQERRVLSHRDPDAAIPARHAGRPQEPAHHQRRARPHRRFWAASATSIARTPMRWCRITPSSPPSTSMPPPRIAIWARSLHPSSAC